MTRGDLLLVTFVLGYLWFALIDQLRVEWTVNPQYNYGWVVPFLCLWLVFRRYHDSQAVLRAAWAQKLSGWLVSLRLPVLGLAFLWFPVRLIEQANPEWRLVSWALALITVGLTLGLLYQSGFRLSIFGFPTCFFLVAVPWPTVVEAPLIQSLTRLNAVGAVEVLAWLGIPALRQGNVIEISSGLVGIEDACSGVRSIQACLMIGLFLGAYYRLRHRSRAGLVLAGVGLALVLNLTRTVLLVSVASARGMDALARWHDPAGVSILVGCFLGVWWLSARFHRSEQKQQSPDGTQADVPPRMNRGMRPMPLIIPAGLLVWVVLSDFGVEAWYRSHERALDRRAGWRSRPVKPGAERRADQARHDLPRCGASLLAAVRPHAGGI